MDLTHIKDALNAQNFRMTKARDSLLSLFADSSRMLTPQGLHNLAREADLRVGLTTVYRLLETLTKVGFGTPVLLDGSIFYTLCSEQHHHHFICLSCHQVLDIYQCPHFDAIPQGYQIQSHRADVFGTCPACAAQAIRESASGTAAQG